MSSNNFTLTIHMVQSLDGMIAKSDNSVDWFNTKDHYEKGIELTNEAMAAFIKTIDCYIMGANTYLHALELSKKYGWVYGDTPTIVVSKRGLPVERANVEIYKGTAEELVNERLKPIYTNVWMAGGAKLAASLIQAGLADEIQLTVLPILLGDGLPFFKGLGIEKTLHLKDVRPYKSGMVELHYEIKK